MFPGTSSLYRLPLAVVIEVNLAVWEMKFAGGQTNMNFLLRVHFISFPQIRHNNSDLSATKYTV
jgi:hypothetical protein